MKIAIFTQVNSPHDIWAVIKNNNLEDKFLYYEYGEYEDINKIYEKNKSVFDGILFSGPVGYNYFINQDYIIKIPVMFIENNFERLYLSLINHLIKYPDIQLNEIYIDNFDDYRFINALSKIVPKELMPQFPRSDIDYNSPTLYEDLYNYIIKLWKDGKIKMAYVAFADVYKRLKDTDLPCYDIILSEKIMLKAVKNIINQVSLNYYLYNNTVVALVDYMYKDRDDLSINDIEYRQATLNKILVDYKKYFSNYGDINIISNLTNFEISFNRKYLGENEDASFLLLDYINKKFEFDFIVGIGTGNDIVECRNRALKAVNFAKNYGDRCGFIIENGYVSGPINSEFKLDFPLSLYYDNIKTAKSLDVSNFNYTRIMVLFNKLKENITSITVSKYLNITQRSVNRIIKKLLSNNIIEDQDSINKTMSKGRPTKYYKLK